MNDIQATRLNLNGKTAKASYDRLLPNGRTESCTIDQAEELQDVAQELFDHGIDALGLDAKAWNATGRVTQVWFKFDDNGEFSVRWEMTRTVIDEHFSEEQKLTTGIYDPDRLTSNHRIYSAANKIQQAIVRFVHQQPVQQSLFPKLEVVA